MSYRREKDPTEIVVIFRTHLRDGADAAAYERASRRMNELVKEIPGFISIKGYRSEDGDEIDIVRFEDEAALEAWRTQPEHLETQERGRDEFYDHYAIQACKVVRDYEWRLDESETTRGSRPTPDQAKGLSAR